MTNLKTRTEFKIGEKVKAWDSGELYLGTVTDITNEEDKSGNVLTVLYDAEFELHITVHEKQCRRLKPKRQIWISKNQYDLMEGITYVSACKNKATLGNVSVEEVIEFVEVRRKK